jgi:hypothetical protein
VNLAAPLFEHLGNLFEAPSTELSGGNDFRLVQLLGSIAPRVTVRSFDGTKQAFLFPKADATARRATGADHFFNRVHFQSPARFLP